MVKGMICWLVDWRRAGRVGDRLHVDGWVGPGIGWTGWMDGWIQVQNREQLTRITETKPRHITAVINDDGMSTDRTPITVAGVITRVVIVVVTVGMGMGVSMGMGVFGVTVIPLPVPVPVSVPVVFAGWCHLGWGVRL